jgi:hypothetical protein
MKNILSGEVWETFHIEGKKVGFIRRQTMATETPDLFVSTLHILFYVQGGVASREHHFWFYNEPGYPAHAYLFDTNNGAPIHGQFKDGGIICQVDEDIFSKAVPSDARPGYGYYPYVVTMPFVEGYEIRSTLIDDASGEVGETAVLVSQGWRDVKLHNQPIRLWLISEYIAGQPANRYWLDEARRLRQSDWQGAKSYWVAAREEAWGNLPDKLVQYARETFATTPDDEWMSDITEWLNQDHDDL